MTSSTISTEESRGAGRWSLMRVCVAMAVDRDAEDDARSSRIQPGGLHLSTEHHRTLCKSAQAGGTGPFAIGFADALAVVGDFELHGTVVAHDLNIDPASLSMACYIRKRFL